MASPVSRTVTSCGKPLNTSPERFGPLKVSSDIAHDAALLQQRFAQDGYLYLPGFLDKADVMKARLSVVELIAQEGALDPAHRTEQAIARPGLDMAFRPELANGNKAVEDLLYSDQVMSLFDKVLGGKAMHYDYTWLRAVAPGLNTSPHYDIVYMGRGTNKICTAWIPLGDIPVHVGGLMILEGSHKLQEVKDSYGQMDVDTVCENKGGIRELNDKGYPGYGAFSEDPAEVAETYGLRWLTNDFHMGDLLTFSMYTMHASTDNCSDQVRLSTDSRYQLASEPADHRWVGPSPIGHGPDARKNLIC